MKSDDWKKVIESEKIGAANNKSIIQVARMSVSVSLAAPLEWY